MNVLVVKHRTTKEFAMDLASIYAKNSSHFYWFDELNQWGYQLGINNDKANFDVLAIDSEGKSSVWAHYEQIKILYQINTQLIDFTHPLLIKRDLIF